MADATAELDRDAVAHLVDLLTKSARAYRLYESNNPMYRTFVGSVQSALEELWRQTSALELAVEEDHLRWAEQPILDGDDRSPLAFLFYRDGIRQLTFLPGFEDEVEPFLEVVERGRNVARELDDMVTLLWEQDFASLRYSYVDQLADGPDLPEGEPEAGGAPVPTDRIAAEARQEEARQAEAGGADTAAEPQERGPGGLAPEDFNQSLYFLDGAELRVLTDELEREWARDLKTDVLNALFDRLEGPHPEDRPEILKILRQLVPAFLSSGDLVGATKILEELQAILARADVLESEEREAAERVYEELSDPAVVEQLVRAMAEGSVHPDAAELTVFLRHVRSQALSALIRSMETTDSPGLRDRLRTTIDRLAQAEPAEVRELLGSSDDMVAAGAVRIAGRLGLIDTRLRFRRLLRRSEASVRLAAVEAMGSTGSAGAGAELQKVLDDPVRDVRMAAARALAALNYSPAADRLETLITSRKLRKADLSEKIALFESYGAIAGEDGILVLNELLNGRTLLMRRRDSEIRACAARALAQVGTRPARLALEQAADDADPVVRNVVVRGLREKASST